MLHQPTSCSAACNMLSSSLNTSLPCGSNTIVRFSSKAQRQTAGWLASLRFGGGLPSRLSASYSPIRATVRSEGPSSFYQSERGCVSPVQPPFCAFECEIGSCQWLQLAAEYTVSVAVMQKKASVASRRHDGSWVMPSACEMRARRLWNLGAGYATQISKTPSCSELRK